MLNDRFKFDAKPELKLNETQRKAKAEVEEKINSGIYTFEEVICVVCGSSKSEIISEKDRYGLKCTTKICCDCGLVYTSPRMTQESYAGFYNSEYRRLYVGTEKPGNSFFADQKFRGERILKYIRDNSKIGKENKEVLEVGCGAGGILSVFKDHGFKITGLDLGEEYLNFGKMNHGLNLIKGGLSDLNPDFKADIIIYSHVFEHILNLDAEIELIKQHLSTDGIVYIEVPGVKFIHSTYEMNLLKYLQNAHTYHFSLNSLHNIFSRNGFSLVCGDEQIRSIFKLKNESEDLRLKNEYSSILEYLRKTEKNRFLHKLSLKKLRWAIKKALLRKNL